MMSDVWEEEEEISQLGTYKLGSYPNLLVHLIVQITPHPGQWLYPMVVALLGLICYMVSVIDKSCLNTILHQG